MQAYATRTGQLAVFERRRHMVLGGHAQRGLGSVNLDGGLEGRPTVEEVLNEKEAARHPLRYAP